MEWLLIISIALIAYVLICGVIALTVMMVSSLLRKDQPKKSFSRHFWGIFLEILFLGMI